MCSVSRASLRLLAGLLVLSLSPPALAETWTHQARSSKGELILVSPPRQPSTLLREDGSRLSLPLPTTARVHSFATVPAAAAAPASSADTWYAAAVDARASTRRLVLLRGAGPKVEEIAAPQVRDADQLREPALLIDAQGLSGLAWIEGRAPRQQLVRVARRSADGWQEPITVSPRGRGSQMALSTTRLHDGSWLLAWAAFDGQDDEIFWSRWDGVTAAKPARLGAGNEAPDITPHLFAAPDGAFAAWSRYDGNDYRLQLARFDGVAWSEPETIGPAGSLYPTFHAGPSGPLLLYLRAVPREWTLAELDGRGKIRREAGLESLSVQRPLIREVDREKASLAWVGPSETAKSTSTLRWREVRHR